jgi:acyl-coenzyme A thioesterase PaaI-like protein
MATSNPMHEIPPGFQMVELSDAFAARLGPLFICRERGLLAFRVTVDHINPVDVCNGGAMATFADMQIMAVDVKAGTRAGHQPTISLSVDYLAPAPLGAWVEAAVTLVKSTRTLIFTQAMISADAAVVARSTAIYRRYD